jgi:hypothetical protein
MSARCPRGLRRSAGPSSVRRFNRAVHSSASGHLLINGDVPVQTTRLACSGRDGGHDSGDRKCTPCRCAEADFRPLPGMTVDRNVLVRDGFGGERISVGSK